VVEKQQHTWAWFGSSFSVNSLNPPVPVAESVNLSPTAEAYDIISQFVSSLSLRTASYAARISGLFAPDILGGAMLCETFGL
jgi:hypothetical protein